MTAGEIIPKQAKVALVLVALMVSAGPLLSTEAQGQIDISARSFEDRYGREVISEPIFTSPEIILLFLHADGRQAMVPQGVDLSPQPTIEPSKDFVALQPVHLQARLVPPVFTRTLPPSRFQQTWSPETVHRAKTRPIAKIARPLDLLAARDHTASLGSPIVILRNPIDTSRVVRTSTSRGTPRVNSSLSGPAEPQILRTLPPSLAPSD